MFDIHDVDESVVKGLHTGIEDSVKWRKGLPLGLDVIYFLYQWFLILLRLHI